MKKLSLLFLFIFYFYHAEAGQYDTTRESGIKSSTFFSFGIDMNYLPMGDLNSKLFGNDKLAGVLSIQALGAANIGFKFNHFFYGFGIERGSDEEESDKQYSKIDMNNYNFQIGYLFNSSHSWKWTAHCGIGYSYYTINTYSKMNPISFDSLLKQSNGSGLVTRSIDLVSNLNFYVQPQIGIEYRFASTSESNHNTTFGIIGGCRLFPNSIDWQTAGGQALSNMPMNLNAIPTLAFQIRYEWGK